MKLQLSTIIYVVLLHLFVVYAEQSDDFYKLLDIPKDADNRDIRKAFKKLAVKLHPDKNKDDPDAEDRFIKLTKAYEILKDPESRKKYDLYGDVTTNPYAERKYQSYTFYRDEFGIYDEDPLIVTLSEADYEINIVDNNQAWFVNFYSPRCDHCHVLAPTWRKLSAEMEGVIRIAAVNCEEDWGLCKQLKIHSYPSLLYYERESHLYEGDNYDGPTTIEALREFVLSHVKTEVQTISPEDWKSSGFKFQQWLLFLCPDNTQCPEYETRLKLAATLDGLMSVAIITDESLCDEIYSEYIETPVVLWQTTTETNELESIENAKVHAITGSDSKEILDGVLALLPDPPTIDSAGFQDIRTQLRIGADKAWLFCFYMGTATDLNLQLKRLPLLVPNVNIGLLHCGKNSGLCSSLHVSHYPAWGVLKAGGAFELHHGRDILHEVASFARESSRSTNFHALSPADFKKLVKEGEPWFIDWFAPWCPPCRKLMPEIRKASQRFTPETVQFGTIDCTLHTNLCSSQGIRSYPTTMLYNVSQNNYYHGKMNEEGIVEFIQDTLNPAVIKLDQLGFTENLVNKPASELWIVDFFAPWCGPCQQLSPHWRQLAKQVAHLDEVHVAQVDCVQSADLCSSQNVRSYPTIRLYPLGSEGLNTVAIYNGHRDTMSIKRWLLGFLPSPVEKLDAAQFRKEIINGDYPVPWLVDFYAPWCGHCVNFEPEFVTVAQRLEGQIRAGKLDCEAYRDMCRQQHVGSYPTVILYLSPDKRIEIASQVASEVIQKVQILIAQHKSLVHDEF